jgi:hypothetical protein
MPTTTHYSSIIPSQSKPSETQYNSVESIRPQQDQSHYKDWNDAENAASANYNTVESLQKQSNYKDWNDAENPAPAHYDKIDVNQ